MEEGNNMLLIILWFILDLNKIFNILVITHFMLNVLVNGRTQR